MSASVMTMSSFPWASSAQATTYSGPSSPSRTRGVSRSRLIRPALSMTPVMNISAKSEIIPEPQMPLGGTPPMTR